MEKNKEEMKILKDNYCPGNPECSLTYADFMERIPGHKMNEVITKGDGHCFYHTCLRFIYENQNYYKNIDVILDKENKKIIDLIPKDYEGYKGEQNQKASDVYLLRKALIQFNTNEFIFSDQSFNAEGVNVYLSGLWKSKENKMASPEEWAGNVSETDFINMAFMLKTCLMIWQFNEHIQKKCWSIFNWSEGPVYMEKCQGKDSKAPNLLNKDCCPLIMFANNKDGVHFNGLSPIKKPLTHTQSQTQSKTPSDDKRFNRAWSVVAEQKAAQREASKDKATEKEKAKAMDLILQKSDVPKYITDALIEDLYNENIDASVIPTILSNKEFYLPYYSGRNNGGVYKKKSKTKSSLYKKKYKTKRNKSKSIY